MNNHIDDEDPSHHSLQLRFLKLNREKHGHDCWRRKYGKCLAKKITLPTYDMSRVANKPVCPIEDPSTPRLWMGPVDKKICKLPLLSGTLSLLWEAGRRWVSKQQNPRQDVGYPWWKSENTQLDDHHKISWYWKQVWSISSLIRASFPIQHKITRPPPRHHHQHHNCHHHHYHHHHHHPPHHHNRQHLTMIIRLGQSTWS